MPHKNGKIWGMLLLLLCLFFTSCGKKTAPETETGTETETETAEEFGNAQEIPGVIIAYTAEGPEDSGQEIPALQPCGRWGRIPRRIPVFFRRI